MLLCYMADFVICILYLLMLYLWLYCSGSNLFATRFDGTVIDSPNGRWRDKSAGPHFTSMALPSKCDLEGSEVSG
jgi:hypothetical protein